MRAVLSTNTARSVCAENEGGIGEYRHYIHNCKQLSYLLLLALETINKVLLFTCVISIFCLCGIANKPATRAVLSTNTAHIVYTKNKGGIGEY